MKQLKSLSEFRTSFNLKVERIHYRLSYFARLDIDMNVFLQSKQKNLQRDFCWSPLQKTELIKSIFLERHIPAISVLNKFNPDFSETYEIIDGKQRISTMLSFLRNEFKIELEEELFSFDELPKEYQTAISCYSIQANIVYEPRVGSITDQQKIDWFKHINFAGTPQDVEFMNSLDE